MSTILQPAAALLPDQHVADLASAISTDKLWTTSWLDVERFRIMPNQTLESDIIVVPEDWSRTKRRRIKTARTVDFSRALPPGLNRQTAEAESIIRRAKRLAAILLVTPISFPSGYVHQPSKPMTWVTECEGINLAMSWVLQNTEPISGVSSCPDGGPIFKRLTRDVLERLRKARGYSSFWKHGVYKLAALEKMGVIDDWPNLDLGSRREPRRKNVEIPITAVQKKTTWQPFEDEFTSKIGQVALWMTEELGPMVLSCLEVALSVPTTSSVDESVRLRMEAVNGWCAAVSNERSGKDFPFKLKIGQFEMSSLPPPNWRALRSVVSLLQTAHMVIVSLSTAARESELIGLQRDCLRAVSSQDLLIGYTFKLSDAADGERREWPLPKVAVEALRQQQRLADLLAAGEEHLWTSFSYSKSSRNYSDLRKLYDVLSKFCRSVIVDGRLLRDWCRDGKPHPHRFRKTVARLAGLSMVGATSIMFDILGHHDPEMTLNYILSDPDLQDEIRKIATESNIALARGVLATAENNDGAAAKGVADLARRIAARSGEAEMGVAELTEAAEILSMNGQVAIVRPGVLCTKTVGQSGPCTKKAGFPDIGNCSTGCSHRLEHAAAASDCTQAIEQILTEMPSAASAMMRSWWQGQLVTQLRRFSSVRTRYAADTRVQAALADVDVGDWGDSVAV
jgi:integrase